MNLGPSGAHAVDGQSGPLSIAVGADRFATRHGAQRPPRVQVDGIPDEADRSITEGDIDALAAVPARRGLGPTRDIDTDGSEACVVVARLTVRDLDVVVALNVGVRRVG